MSSIKIGWGRSEDGKLIHVREARQGKECNCTCPDCGLQLIAKQGQIMAWHFAHSQPTECFGESILHKVAKEIIREAIDTKDFLIPGIKRELISEDLLGNPIKSSWQMEEELISITSAVEEYTLPNNQITDVLLTSNSLKNSLAVEIYVTHKKSDLDISKFSDIQQNGIEIDLSDVDPLLDRDRLEQIVLLESKRYWLFNAEEISAKLEHEQKVDKINQSYAEEMLGLVIPAISSGSLKNLRFLWPELSRKLTTKTSFGEVVHGAVRKVPKITSLNTENEPQLNGHSCLTEALVENAVKISVCFTLLGTDIPKISKDRPLLVFEYDPSSKQFYLSWFQISKWERKLDELAEQNLKENVAKQENLYQTKHQNELAYAKRFSEMSDRQRIDSLSSELSLPPPYKVGQYVDYWNTTWHIWKTLIWKYKIIKKQGKTVNVENISKDRWLAQILKWPESEEAQIQRSKTIWWWFRDLEKIGVMEHDGNMFFIISNELPEKFIPWKKLK